MYNQQLFIPKYYNLPNIINTAMIPATPKRIPLFNRIGNIFQGIKTFNWTELINNTSKTLGIINQSIPLVKQTGPLLSNMRSMIKLASVFKDETDIKPQHLNKETPNIESYNSITKTESPTFFIE